MTVLADLLSNVFERRLRFSSPATDDDRPVEELCTALISTSGEVSGRTLGSRILDLYEAMDDEQKLSFFRYLANTMNIRPQRVRSALTAYEANPGKETYRAYMAEAEPPRQELIRRLNQVPAATARIVKMRADLLRLSAGQPPLAALDMDFRHLFYSWFNRGFLVLLPINWESQAHILEKIIAYEAVHEITSWGDLRRRVEPEDRRCFAFFHPAMPHEPLIFVEVALTKGGASSIDDLLSSERTPIAAPEADTAVFYSISNCQAGLSSISFGSSLIKQVVADLSSELPNLAVFLTLSPIPGMTGWMATEDSVPTNPQVEALPALAAYYLVEVKRSDGLPADSVARFHLGNGAQIHKVHADADRSEKGMAQSRGTMVNYLYDQAHVAEQHEGYAAAKKVAASADILGLVRAAKKLLQRKPGDVEPAV